jgi:hypothetical protein
MLNTELIEGIQTELSGLYHKRPALALERFKVLKALYDAKYITPDLRKAIESHYNREMDRITEDIAGMEANLKRIKGGGPDA